MCGIAGYVGPRNATEVVFDQLRRLEYRGYDSAGIAYETDDELKVLKSGGKLDRLGDLLKGEPIDSRSAMAHSRWATHGTPNTINAHPHFDQTGEVALVHNGIIENYASFKGELTAQGHVFQSETDSEVAAHVIGKAHAEGLSLEEAVRKTLPRLRGAYAFVVMSHREPGRIICARNASPLIIGFGEDENFLASDVPAILPYTRRVLSMPDDTVAVIERSGVRISDLKGRELPLKIREIDWDVAEAEKGGYQHFMIKEIHEQPDVARSAMAGRLTEDDEVVLDGVFSDHVWQEIDRVNVIGCGTAYHAGLMGKHLFERMLRLPTDVFYSSEFRYGDPLLSERSLAVFISQSGETADSLAALRLCKQRRIRTLGIVNVVGSAIARECDRVIYTQAGPEISVASTKAYTAQCLVMMLLALTIAQHREMPGVSVADTVRELRQWPDLAQEALALEPEIKEVAEKWKDAPLAFFLGRNADAAVALEAALKMKEIAYLPTQEGPAGEIKHGPLALVEPGVLAVFGATDPGVREKLVSNVHAVQARGGHGLVVTTRDDTTMDGVADAVVKIPSCDNAYLNALLSVVPLQLLSYHVALARGCEIDQPRNLAKSVTVE